MVNADLRRLKQILVNLLSNAVKFTPEGGQIGLEIQGDVAEETVRFTIWDTGIGIAPENLPLLFKSFMQIDSRLARQYEGTGLGLTLVARLVEMHGGSVAVESRLGMGSRFSVMLPWQPSSEFGKLLDNNPVAQAVTFQRVLVIEDTGIIAQQLGRYLHELKVDTIVLDEAPRTLTKVVEAQPDLILLDLLLPGKSGWEVLTQLKAEPRTRDIPVIIVSVVDERSKGLALGAVDYLVKPVSRQQLQQALVRVTAQQRESSRGIKRTVKTADKVAMPGGKAANDAATAEAAAPLVLVADDNELNLQAIVDYLTAAEYRVIVARNGLEALERTVEDNPAAIVMDIQMPKMDGLEAIRHIRAKAASRHTPIIALTALAMQGDRERCLDAGANEYLSKPVRLKALVKTIEEQLTQAAAGS